MLSAYANFRFVDDARELFDRMPDRNVISWTAMLSGLLRDRRTQEAKVFFEMMPERNVVSWNSMISGLVRYGDIYEAKVMFDSMPHRNLASWNIMMSGFSRNGDHEEVILLFLRMAREFRSPPNLEIFIALLHSCAGLELPRVCLQVHAQMVTSGVVLEDLEARMSRSLIQCYAHLGAVDWAAWIFRRIPSRFCYTVCWNSMIVGYSRAGQLDEARRWFEETPFPDRITSTIMMSTCFDAGDVVSASKIFEDMSERDGVAWTAAISGLIQNELFHEAFGVFSNMMVAGVPPADRTFAVLLGAAGSAASLDTGRQLHSLAIRTRPKMDTPAVNSLVAMYAKCGDSKAALQAFTAIVAKDLVSWNTVILGLSHHGLAREALDLFDEMPFERDSVSFLGALMACSQVGLLRRGQEIFGTIPAPGPEHYACMVHLLARLGRAEEAEELLELSSEPSVAAWGALVAACGEDKAAVAERAAQQVLELEPWNVPSRLKLCRQGKGEWPIGLKRTPAMSWVVVKGRTHVFLCGDTSHPDNEEIRALLGSGNLIQ